MAVAAAACLHGVQQSAWEVCVWAWAMCVDGVFMNLSCGVYSLPIQTPKNNECSLDFGTSS